ncbi:nucleotidyltransferase family protein [bacterium]|nr:nucleotidyltransferase family protein [bacterium]
MKALVLAAGVGSRLGEITQRTPKCMLPVAGRPLLDYWMESLTRVGVKQTYVNTHYLAERVRPYLQSKPHGVEILEGFEPELLGSAGTLARAREFLSSDDCFLIIYADNYGEIDLARLIAFHEMKKSPPLVLLAYHTPEPNRCGILELDHDGRVVGFEEKPQTPKSDIANSGIHVATRDLFDLVPQHVPADIGFHVLPKLIGKMFAYVTDEFIQDIGTPESYASVRARRENMN